MLCWYIIVSDNDNSYSEGDTIAYGDINENKKNICYMIIL